MTCGSLKIFSVLFQVVQCFHFQVYFYLSQLHVDLFILYKVTCTWLRQLLFYSVYYFKLKRRKLTHKAIVGKSREPPFLFP